MPSRDELRLVLVSCPRNNRYIAGGQLAVFQGASEAPISEPYGSIRHGGGKTVNWPRPEGTVDQGFLQVHCEQINRPFGTGSTFLLFPGTSCQATFVWSLRDRIHSFIVGFCLN
jgi:hypothetical protein